MDLDQIYLLVKNVESSLTERGYITYFKNKLGITDTPLKEERKILIQQAFETIEDLCYEQRKA